MPPMLSDLIITIICIYVYVVYGALLISESRFALFSLGLHEDLMTLDGFR